MASLAVDDIPEEFVGMVVSRPTNELPIVNAKQIRDTKELHMGGKGIEVLWGFDRFTNLEVLWINNNKLTELENLDECVRLQRLYAFSNKIRTICDSSLPCFKFLRELDLSDNAISNLGKSLEVLAKLPFLEHLELHGNPLAEEAHYRLRVIHELPGLHVFDRHVITDQERAAANKKFGALSRKRTDGVKKSTGGPRVTPVQRMLERDVARIKKEKEAAEKAARRAMFSGAKSRASSGAGGAGGADGKGAGLTSAFASAMKVGTLTEWQTYRLQKLFKDMDKDSSGSLSRDELRAGLEDAQDLGFRVKEDSVEHIDAVFDALDTDGSNSISWKEFIKGITGEIELEAPDSGEPVDPLEFRSLSSEEATARAAKYSKEAAAIQTSLLRMPDGDSRRAALQRKVLDLGARASKLEDLASSTSGKYSDGAPPVPVAAPRSDYIGFISTVPKSRAVKALSKGAVVDPTVSDSDDSDTDDEDGKLSGAEIDVFRKRRRARKPHVVVTSTVALPGGRELE